MAAQARSLADVEQSAGAAPRARGRSSATGRRHPRGARGCIAGAAGAAPHGARPVCRSSTSSRLLDGKTISGGTTDGRIVRDRRSRPARRSTSGRSRTGTRRRHPQRARRSGRAARRGRAPHAGLGRLGAHPRARWPRLDDRPASSSSVAVRGQGSRSQPARASGSSTPRAARPCARSPATPPGWLSESGDGKRLAIESNAAPWTVTTIDIDSGDPVGPVVTLRLASQHRAQSRRRSARDRCRQQWRRCPAGRRRDGRRSSERHSPATASRSRSAMMARSWRRSDSRPTSVCSTRPTARRSFPTCKVDFGGAAGLVFSPDRQPPPRGERERRHRHARPLRRHEARPAGRLGRWLALLVLARRTPRRGGERHRQRRRLDRRRHRAGGPRTTTGGAGPAVRPARTSPPSARTEPGWQWALLRTTTSLQRSRSSRRWTGSRSATCPSRVSRFIGEPVGLEPGRPRDRGRVPRAGHTRGCHVRRAARRPCAAGVGQRGPRRLRPGRTTLRRW